MTAPLLPDMSGNETDRYDGEEYDDVFDIDGSLVVPGDGATVEDWIAETG